jgi:hypothetical protein
MIVSEGAQQCHRQTATAERIESAVAAVDLRFRKEYFQFSDSL